MVSYRAEQSLLNSSALVRRFSSNLPWKKKYRSYLEIIASLLDATSGEAQDRYCLMKQTGANYAQLKKYLQSLLKMGFIEAAVTHSQIFYKVTRRGLAFLSQYYVLLEILLDAQQANKGLSLDVPTSCKTMSFPGNPALLSQNNRLREETLFPSR